MPICTREGFDAKPTTNQSKSTTFLDSEEVFYCETTKEIFRDYEDYFRHVMLINSTIWQCEETGKENLTYAEALYNEKKARKKMETFKQILRAPTLLAIDKAQQSGYKEIFNLVYTLLKDRYFLGEIVQACVTSSANSFHECKVTEIIPPQDAAVTDDDVLPPIYDANKIKYKVQKLSGVQTDASFIVPYQNIKRSRFEFGRDNLQLFIKDSVHRVQGIIKPKPETYKKYITDKNMVWSKLYIGRIPEWTPSKPKKEVIQKPKKEKVNKKDSKTAKQPSMTKYVVKSNQIDPAEKQRQEQSLREQMERLRKEKEEKAAEAERKRLERLEKIEIETKGLVCKTDDLERNDQKLLPKYKPIKTIVPTKYFADFIFIQEFLHSFVGILSGTEDAFLYKNISFFETARALSYREVAGPLSGILVVLLSTIFSLQSEEEEECAVEYRKPSITSQNEPWPTIREATATQHFVRKHYSNKLHELPVDSQTLSEVLRLHLLAGGANTDDKSDRWRYMYRNGYFVTEDPGLALRMSQPHILRALKLYTVYQLPMADILKIIQCLISQILTYSNTLTIVDERSENVIKSKQRIRVLIIAENKRVSQIQLEKKKLQIELSAKIVELNSEPEKRKLFEEELQKKYEVIDAKSAKEKKTFEQEMQREYASIFNFMVYLGMDRAYRKYYVFESIFGLFVEHPLECNDICLENPPDNWFELSQIPKNRVDVKKFLTKHYQQQQQPKKTKKVAAIPTNTESELVIKADLEADKENLQNLKMNGELNGKLNGMPNGDTKHLNGEIENDNTVVVNHPSQYDLYMCTGNPKHCIVHDCKNPERQRWSYISTEIEVEALINSLNSMGERESFLREQLITYKPLLINHIKKCPTDYFDVDAEDKHAFRRITQQMLHQTQNKFSNSNYGLGLKTDINVVMFSQCVEKIMQLEVDITTGCLGKMRLNDLKKWRQDLIENSFDPQIPLKWGVEEYKFEDPGENLGNTIEIESEDSSDEDVCNYDSPELKANVKSLASALLQVEQSIEPKFFKAPFGLQKEIRNKDEKNHQMAKAQHKLKLWEVSLMSSTNYSSIFLHLNILYDSIKWNRSINSSCCIICRRKSDPDQMLLCDECNAGTHMFCLKPKLKKIPEGNWYCRRCVEQFGYSNNVIKEKSKRKKFIPQYEDEDAKSESSKERGHESESDEFIPEEERQQMRKEKRLKQIYKRKQLKDVSEEEEDESDKNEEYDDDDNEICKDSEEQSSAEEGNESADDDEDDDNSSDSIEEDEDEDEENDDDDEGACNVCSYNGCDVGCSVCKLEFHIDCVGLKRAPRIPWKCPKCKLREEKKRKASNPNSSEDESDWKGDGNYEDEPLSKRQRQNPAPSTSKRSRNSLNQEEQRDSQSTSTSSNRRSRRTGDLPLNGVALYELLGDVFKNENSWPFLRPVSQTEVPDYYDIIKRPMDFAKIKSKLNMGQYRINEELLNDIQLIFKNCDAYNSMGNEIYSAGANLEKFIIKKCKKLNLPFIPSDMNSL